MSAAKKLKAKGVTIAEILAKIDEQGGPKEITPGEELVRIRMLYQALTDKAVEAAEREWPGFEAAIGRLMRRENDLMRRGVFA